MNGFNKVGEKKKKGLKRAGARPLAYYSPFLSLSSAREKALKGSISGEIENETIENMRYYFTNHLSDSYSTPLQVS
jgi:hypothetical protein